ncbi:MAG: hypothetical protein Q8O19_01280 [Rectinemataceae bacterium]|nr:hypothetical protein [Rectinemataceae bacterium]
MKTLKIMAPAAFVAAIFLFSAAPAGADHGPFTTLHGIEGNYSKVNPGGSIQVDEPKVATAAEGQVSCGTTTSVLRAANTARISIAYQNVSVTTVRICHAATCVAANAGKRLKEDSGFLEKNYTGAISCITDSGTATVSFTEE